jgi:hypothetical protein
MSLNMGCRQNKNKTTKQNKIKTKQNKNKTKKIKCFRNILFFTIE